MTVEYAPWMQKEGNEGAIARREIRLPVDCQMQGHMQALRDAVLATMLFSEHLTPMDPNPWKALETFRIRQNAKGDMQRRVRFLEARAKPETIKKCHEAAVKLLRIEIARQKQEQLKAYQPDTSRTISPEAYSSYWLRAKKAREAKEQEGLDEDLHEM